MKANVDIWASEFAEGYGLDDRCINFMLRHPEIIEGSQTKEENKDGSVVTKGNLRIWTKYFDSISGITDFSKNVDLIMNLGMGSLPSEHVILFTTFIKNGLDKLPTPEFLVTSKVENALAEIKKIAKIDEGNKKRQDIIAIITKRLLNYALVNEEKYDKQMVENYAQILESGLLSEDLCIISLKKLVSKSKFKTFIHREKLLNYLV